MSPIDAKRDTAWIGCIDFGTALSKFAMVRAVDREELTSDDIKPLAIAYRPDVQTINDFLLPSVVYLTKDKVLFGQEAEQTAKREEPSGRLPFTSPKQYLSTHDIEDLDVQLEREIDPNWKFTPRHLLQLFLAYLLERAGSDAGEQGLPWPVKLRIARPAWKAQRAAEGEIALKELVKDGFVLVDILGKNLSAKGGLAQKQALAALKKLKPSTVADPEIFELVGNNQATIREATAAASGSLSHMGRRVIAVAYIGGGTSDFGAFLTGLPKKNVLAEVADSCVTLREAGDHLDMLLQRHILSEAGLSPGHPAAAGAINRLRVFGRQYKERLFEDGTQTIPIGDRLCEINLQKFLNEPEVEAFANELQSHFNNTLSLAVACAREYSTRRTKIPVEFLFTGGGYKLPMVQNLYEKPSIDWEYRLTAPDLASSPEDLDFYAIYRQLAVAIGGAIEQLPQEVAPVKLRRLPS